MSEVAEGEGLGSDPVVASSGEFGTPCVIVSQSIQDDSVEVKKQGAQWHVEAPEGSSESSQLLVEVLMAREDGDVNEIWLTQVRRGFRSTVFHLTGNSAREFANIFRSEAWRRVSSSGDTDVTSPRVDDSENLRQIFDAHPGAFRDLLRGEIEASDLINVSYRRKVVQDFRRLLTDEAYFAEAKGDKQGNERVWQNFFEENPWLLGYGLGSVLMLGWDDSKLEKVVAGQNVSSSGKRIDALLATTGAVKSLVFAEIKTPDTPLLDERRPYRPGTWRISEDLAGAVAQVQATGQLAVAQLGERIQETTAAGADVNGSFGYLIQPELHVVIGRLSQLQDETGGDFQDRIRSFELFRRSLSTPKIITFDELLARAEWLVDRGNTAPSKDTGQF